MPDIKELVEQLPPDLEQEVRDFVEFLIEITGKSIGGEGLGLAYERSHTVGCLERYPALRALFRFAGIERRVTFHTFKSWPVSVRHSQLVPLQHIFIFRRPRCCGNGPDCRGPAGIAVPVPGPRGSGCQVCSPAVSGRCGSGRRCAGH